MGNRTGDRTHGGSAGKTKSTSSTCWRLRAARSASTTPTRNRLGPLAAGSYGCICAKKQQAHGTRLCTTCSSSPLAVPVPGLKQRNWGARTRCQRTMVQGNIGPRRVRSKVPRVTGRGIPGAWTRCTGMGTCQCCHSLRGGASTGGTHCHTLPRPTTGTAQGLLVGPGALAIPGPHWQPSHHGCPCSTGCSG
jgi:hypothetical protein